MALYAIGSNGCEIEVAGDPAGFTAPVVTVAGGALVWAEGAAAAVTPPTPVLQWNGALSQDDTYVLRMANDVTVDGAAMKGQRIAAASESRFAGHTDLNGNELSISGNHIVGLPAGDYEFYFKYEETSAFQASTLAFDVAGFGSGSTTGTSLTGGNPVQATFIPNSSTSRPYAKISFTIPAGTNGISLVAYNPNATGIGNNSPVDDMLIMRL